MKMRVTSILLVVLLLGSCLAGCSFSVGDLNLGDFELTEEHFVELDAFESIEAAVSAGSVEIITGDSYSIRIKTSDNYPELSYSNEDKRLKVTENDQNDSVLKGQCKVEVTVPKNTALGDITVTTNMGRAVVKEITAGTVSVTSNMGEIEFDTSQADSLTLTSNMGAVIVKDAFAQTVSLTTDVGAVQIKSFKDIADATLDLSSDLGAVTLDGEKVKNPYHRDGTGAKITASTNMGAVTVS